MFFFSKISVLSVVLFPVFYSGGIRFLVEEAAEMCVTEYGATYADAALILPIPEGGEEARSCQRQCRNGKVRQAVVPLGPAQTHTHM